jgi:hypothetical protein
MIKRDTIQRVIITLIDDGEGGNTTTREYKEIIPAHISINATFGEIAQFGVKQQMIIHATTDYELDDYICARYQFSDKLFKLMRQVKRGNEYFSVLMEVNE